MKKLIYVEENFISPDDCQKFIDLSLTNKGKEMPYGDETRGGDTYLTTVEWKDHTAVYLGGDVEPTIPSLDDKVVINVNDICKSFDPDIILDYVGVVRWPVGTFMKPHFDKNDVYGGTVCAGGRYPLPLSLMITFTTTPVKSPVPKTDSRTAPLPFLQGSRT